MFIRMLQILLLVFCTGKIIAQQVVATAGGEGAANEINLQWTLGECVIAETELNSSVTLTQGFQQPFYVVEPGNDNAIETPEFSGKLNVFPVPASDFLTIDCEIDNVDGITATLTDLNGKTLIRQQLTGNQNQIDMQPLEPSVYLLILTDKESRFIKSFKITKR